MVEEVVRASAPAPPARRRSSRPCGRGRRASARGRRRAPTTSSPSVARQRVVDVARLGVGVVGAGQVPGAEGGHHLLHLDAVAVVEHPGLVVALQGEARRDGGQQDVEVLVVGRDENGDRRTPVVRGRRRNRGRGHVPRRRHEQHERDAAVELESQEGHADPEAGAAGDRRSDPPGQVRKVETRAATAAPRTSRVRSGPSGAGALPGQPSAGPDGRCDRPPGRGARPLRSRTAAGSPSRDRQDRAGSRSPGGGITRTFSFRKGCRPQAL